MAERSILPILDVCCGGKMFYFDMEHILVMEAIIGRHLSKDECVHHIDKNRANNKKENLILMTKSEHMSFHAKERHQQRRNDLSIQ